MCCADPGVSVSLAKRHILRVALWLTLSLFGAHVAIANEVPCKLSPWSLWGEVSDLRFNYICSAKKRLASMSMRVLLCV